MILGSEKNKLGENFELEKSKVYISITSYVMAMIFLYSRIISFMMFPITKFDEDFRIVSIIGHRIFMVIYLIVFAIITANVLFSIIKKKNNLFLFFLPLIITVPIAIYVTLEYKSLYLSDSIDMLLKLNLAYYSGYILYHYKLYDVLTKRIETLSIVMMPALLYYGFLMGTATNTDGRSLGSVNYQAIALASLPIILTLTINFIKYKDYKLFGFINLKYNNCIRALLIFVLWYFVIISSGTRSVIFAFLLFSGLCVICTLYIRENRIKGILIFVITIILFAFQMVYPLEESSSNRTTLFLENVSNGEIKTTTSVESATTDQIEMLISGELIAYSKAEGDINAVKIGDRGILFRLAFLEGLDKPFTGLGAKGFQDKYGMYPHNMVLEIIADFGIITGSILILLIIGIFIISIILSRNDKNLAYTILFIMGYFVVLMSSGSLYETIPLFFALGLAIPYIIDKGTCKKRSLSVRKN